MDGFLDVTKLEPIILWNPRGRAILVDKPERVNKLLQQNWYKAGKDVEVGDYNPTYDQEQDQYQPSPGIKQTILDKKTAHVASIWSNLIEC